MKQISTVVVVTAALVFAVPAPAAADITAFLGAGFAPKTRSTSGFAVGVSLLVAGFEFEYGKTREDALEGAPSLTAGMFNGLIQTPTSGFQIYATAGGGIYRERLATPVGTTQETSVGTNVGGGVKIGLAGPIRLRIDYRIFRLRGSPIEATPKRFYAGVNIAF
jgi:opacity protein-like surface antigen